MVEKKSKTYSRNPVIDQVNDISPDIENSIDGSNNQKFSEPYSQKNINNDNTGKVNQTSKGAGGIKITSILKNIKSKIKKSGQNSEKNLGHQNILNQDFSFNENATKDYNDDSDNAKLKLDVGSININNENGLTNRATDQIDDGSLQKSNRSGDYKFVEFDHDSDQGNEKKFVKKRSSSLLTEYNKNKNSSNYSKPRDISFDKK
ncbi:MULTISPECIES: hypothetical protein [Cysteiniphilum]|uniref:hypothetical protein n=1 Tax=Cysteiniphilum TaxID=2056696 RepID=UPI00177CBA4D|nr:MULTISPECIES: hypothetical protein [Cysteiniphilum]